MTTAAVKIKRLSLLLAMGAILSLSFAGSAVARKPGDTGKRKGQSAGPSLSSFLTRISTGNRVEFNLSNNGYLAVDPSRGAVTPGGFWPSGSEDAYIYQSGLNVLGIIDADGDGIASDVVETNLVFDSEWREGRSGDDPDDPKSRLYFSTAQADLDEWPDEFMVQDANPLSSTYGQVIPDVRSEQDIVGIYTDVDGPLNSGAGSLHLGVEVRQHVLQYSLNSIQDVVFVIWDLYNASRYVSEPGVQVPYDIREAFVNIRTDFDIGENALDDRCAVSPVRNMSIAFDSDFKESNFDGAPAFLGISFMEGPTDHDGMDNPNSLFPAGNGLTDETFGDILNAGIKNPRTGLFFEFHQDVLEEKAERMSLFTITTNGGERPDPVDDAEAYRIYSGDPREVLAPQFDPYADLILADIVGDIRQNIISGPFELPENDMREYQRVVAAFFFARPLQSEVNLNNLSTDGELKPIMQLWKAASTVYRNSFVVPSPPQAPSMKLLPGDREVTVTWDDLPVEAVDPYSMTEEAAALPQSPDFPGLGYRARDFEGFRVYRSQTGNASDAKLIAQYDLDNGFRTYSITRAKATGQGLEDIVEEIPLGTNTGLGFSFTDRGDDIGGLVNGVPLFYMVTAYDFNPVLVGNESLESSINFRRQDTQGRFFQLAVPRSNSTSIVSGSGAWQQVDYYGNPVSAGLPTYSSTIGSVDNALTSDTKVVEFEEPVAPVASAFAADLSSVSVVDPENVTSLGGYLVVDSIVHTKPDTRNHMHYIHFEGPDSKPTTNGAFSVPYHGIEGLYPEDELAEQVIPFSFSGPLVSDGPAFNGTAYFRQGALKLAKVAPLKVKPSGAAGYLELTDWSAGSFEEMGELHFQNFHVLQPFVSTQLNGLLNRTLCVAGQFAPGSLRIRWLADGSIDVWDEANNVPVRFNERVADGWGFLPLDRFSHDEIYDDQILHRSTQWLTSLVSRPAYYLDPEHAGAEMMSLYVRGVELQIRNILVRPVSGDEWRLNMDFLNSLSVTTRYTAPFAGMRVALNLTPAQKSNAPGRLDNIRVVPNPYIASSVYDPGPNKRAIMFTNLPLRATIRIYTISGNLVNLLRHAPGLDGSVGGVSDRNSGQFSFDLTTRFGDQMASGIYYFHVRDDETGEEFLGKFSIIQ